MELKLDAKLLKACNGVFMFVIAIVLMAASYIKLLGEDGNIGWLIGLFMMFMACATGYASYLEKCNLKLGAIACLYLLFAIVLMAKKGVAALWPLFCLWAMIEGTMLALDGWKQKEEKAAFWYVILGFGALAILFGFIGCFLDPVVKISASDVTMKMHPLVGLSVMFAGLGQIFPVCEQFLPKK